MKFARFSALAAAALVVACAPMVKADEVEVQFSGVITNADGAPGLHAGQSFIGGFSYSVTDPLDISIGGQSTYSLTSSADEEFVTAGVFDLSIQPLAGVHAVVSPGTASFFSIQDFSNPGISIELNGGSSFLTSQALPDPFLAADVASGNIGFGFSLDYVDYSVQGNITEVSAVPEPRGVGLPCFGIVVLALLLRRAHSFSILRLALRFATPAV